MNQNQQKKTLKTSKKVTSRSTPYDNVAEQNAFGSSSSRMPLSSLAPNQTSIYENNLLFKDQIDTELPGANRRPTRDARKRSAPLDFADEHEFFKKTVPLSHVLVNTALDTSTLSKTVLKPNDSKKKGKDDEEDFSIIGENSESVDFSDSENVLPSAKKAKLSSHASSFLDDPLQDNRSFVRFMKEEKLVEVTIDWDTYPKGSVVEIKDNGELWIAEEKTQVFISKATRDILKKEKVWVQSMNIGADGYVLYGSSINSVNSKLRNPRKIVTSTICSMLAGKAKKKTSLSFI